MESVRDFLLLLYLLFRLACYLSLAVLVLGFAVLIVLELTGACPRIDTGAIECSFSIFEYLASFVAGLVMICMYTILPVFLALAGLVLLIPEAYFWYRRSTQPTDYAWPHAPGWGKFFAKSFGVVFAAFVLISVIGGILGGGAFQ